MAFKNPKPGESIKFNINEIPTYKKSNTGSSTIDKTLHFVDINCSDFIRDMKKARKYLFHGYMTNFSNPIILGKPYTKREPLDTNQKLQNSFDKILKSQGFTALRSNSIFCTSDYRQADDYGIVYYIFPINGFSYTWSVKHGDWFITDSDFNISGYNIMSFHSNLSFLLGKYYKKLTHDLKSSSVNMFYNLQNKLDTLYDKSLNMNFDKYVQQLKIVSNKILPYIGKYNSIKFSQEDCYALA